MSKSRREAKEDGGLEAQSRGHIPAKAAFASQSAALLSFQLMCLIDPPEKAFNTTPIS
ncbi:uncharacterized protein G2W53_017735 [Senna tora]|uniref:Uncharacterized protein n=1 Tax=Senna tora TaxID=362788 RepID=A0A834TTD6_9FABA|nr:uncharacterized protein G2W53_017735 [Senna tora]